MADLVTATITQNAKINLETYKTGTDTLAFDAAILADQLIPIAATVEPVAGMAFDKDLLQFLYILSDQVITLTFTLGTGSLAITLAAGVPWVWTRTNVATIVNPFLYDGVSCLAANASGVAATLTIRGGVTAS